MKRISARRWVGYGLAVFGSLLLVLPFLVLAVPANSAGDGGPNYLPFFIAILCFLISPVVLIIASVLLKRPK